MGPLASLYAQLLEESLARRFDPTPAPRPHQGLLEDRPMPPGIGPRPYRDPMQAGPSPGPGPLQRVFGSPTVRGNIDVMHRPQVHNADGSTSTVRSMSFSEGGPEILVPTVADDGSRILSDDDAIAQYHRTGRHLGMFDTPDSATAFAGRLHDQQAALGEARSQHAGDMGPEARRALRLTSRPRAMGPLSALYGGNQ